jgi:hypothetical protein
MTETEKADEWVRFFRVAVAGYGLNALLSCLENDGEKMLGRVLERLGLQSSLDLLREISKRR